MALATNVGIEHLPLNERPQYGQPYPEGIAVAASNVADDASGDAHTFSLNADPGFLYRLELVNWTRGATTAVVIHCITTHRWAAAKTPFDAASFDLNWFLTKSSGSGFAVYVFGGGGGSTVPTPVDFQMVRRFPMGAALGGGAPGVSTQLMLLTNESNTDTITNEVSVVWTYWRKEALFLPGFLSAFYEAPAVPPVIRI